jgi:succinoglycan biosynthesis transport protein ExoP
MPDDVSPVRVLYILRRRKFLAIVSSAALLTVAIAVIQSIRPYYDSSAAVLIETRKNAFSGMQASDGIVSSDLIALRTQADLVQSTTIAGDVVHALDLTRSPEYVRLLDAPPSLVQRAITKASDLLSIKRPSGISLTQAEREQAVTGVLLSQVTVNNVGRSYVMEIKARTGEPKLSADVANAFADAFLAFNRNQKRQAITRGSDVLETQMDQLRKRVGETETVVQRFREINGLVLNNGGSQSGHGTTLAGQQLIQLNTELTAANANLAQQEASLSAVQAAQRSGRGLYSLSDVIASPVIQKLRDQEAQLMQRQALNDPVLTPNNPLIQSSRAELSSVRGQIEAEMIKVVGAMSNQVTTARARRDSLARSVQALQSTVATQNEASVSLQQLENEAQAAREVYRSFVDKHEQISSQMALQEPDASLVARAKPPLSRTGPPRGLYAALATLVSGVGGVLATLIVERMRGSTIRTLDQLEPETGLFALGMIPNVPRSGWDAENRRRPVRRRARVHWMGAGRTLGILREVLRSTGNRSGGQVMMITSALPKEGKTWTAIAAATSARSVGTKTLLIDWDMRQPRIAELLGLMVDEAPDLGQADRKPYVLRRDAIPGLDVASFDSAGSNQPTARSIEALTALLASARTEYDLIVVDTPPILLFADAGMIAHLADGVVMVVKWQETDASAVRDGLHALQLCGAHVLGGVLTQVRTEMLTTEDGGARAAYRTYSSYVGRSGGHIGARL